MTSEASKAQNEKGEMACGDLQEGIVLKVLSGTYIVQAEADKSSDPPRYTCILRGTLRKQLTYTESAALPRRVVKAKMPPQTDVVAVGDRVLFSILPDHTGVIEEVLPRRTRFARAAFRGKEQTLVTNLDQLVVVFACAEPNPDPWRIDRWLVAAEAFGLEAVLVANKRDLVDETQFQRSFGEFAALGYKVLPTSALKETGIEPLRHVLRGRISAFTGPSGVGKSSLLNVLQPGLHLKVGAVGDVTHRGRHTTTVRELFPLEGGGWVADTPGLRQLELPALSRQELAECFVDFRPFLATPCRFRDCRHETEPGCNIKMAVEQGHLSARRYRSFLEIAHELEQSRPK
ncbi:ribosome small subunit-dependent GTPase A [Chthonomonas calidirosea]|uniref:Small ribosomal subunit biogenesis GTPase RsgA n=1 Tax=Chthonomonas calidirosea (strain DSM 23976 / ICMP 18418 / T49) TaxID=1303518 RepID=S0EZD7_CHTCT|nr:ribosome small subunit-dependent GTPase A [Chthonomonas calidirosea]CCW35707.1 ribosome small subunit-dependent GTPase A [Chthonomonas calidirosea T49]CEK19478.1 ribosome small subunit-dependent GTPase A [Chthonomonas calidirosea]